MQSRGKLILSVLNLIPNRLSPNSRFIRTSETLEGIKRALEETEILISSVKYMIFFPTSFTKEKVWKLGYESIFYLRSQQQDLARKKL